MDVRVRLLTAGAMIAAAAIVGGCGSGHNSPVMPSARLEAVPGSAAGRIVLTEIGAERIGLRVARARGIPAPAPIVTTWVGPLGVRHRVVTQRPRAATVSIPYSSVIYDPSGRTIAFVAVGRLTFVETPISIAWINGDSAYLRTGPRAGAQVASTGAEELYGVQTGVLAQT
jgi:hypothetical protein